MGSEGLREQRLAKTLHNTKYASKIIKAGALRPDTKLLLQNWDERADVQTNLDRVRQENLFGKASRSRVEDILLVFKQRYLKDDSANRCETVPRGRAYPQEQRDHG